MKPITVLLAEDHQIVREGFRSLLKHENDIEVIGEAETGRQAVQMTRKLRPAVVVMDIAMPLLNGLEATRQIHQVLPRTEIMLLASQNSEQLAQDAFDAGAHILILKSDAKRMLVSAIESAARHNPFFSAVGPWPGEQSRLQSATPRTKTSRPRSRLTPREREIVQLVVEGRTNREIAALLVRSIRTVETHRANVMNKLGLDCLTELVRYAVRNKIIQG